MPARPNITSTPLRKILSLIGGVLIETAFILWFIVLILGAASVAIFLLNAVI